MQTFTTRSAIVAFLVSIGKPLAHAKVAITEGYDFGDGSDDLARRDDWDGIDNLSDDFVPGVVSEGDAIMMYDTFCGDDGLFVLTDKGFECDGNPASYTVDGDYIKEA